MTIHIVTYKELRNRIPKTPFASIEVDQIHRKIHKLHWYNFIQGDYASRRLGTAENLILVVYGTYFDGQNYYVGTLALDPKTLEVKWSIPFPQNYEWLIVQALADSNYIYAYKISDAGSGKSNINIKFINYDGETEHEKYINTITSEDTLLPEVWCLVPNKLAIIADYGLTSKALYLLDTNTRIYTTIEGQYGAVFSDGDYIYSFVKINDKSYIQKIDNKGNILAQNLAVSGNLTATDKFIISWYAIGFFIYDKNTLSLIKQETLPGNSPVIDMLAYNNGYIYVKYYYYTTDYYYEKLMKYNLSNFTIEWDIIIYSAYTGGGGGGIAMPYTNPRYDMAVYEDGTVLTYQYNKNTSTDDLIAINPDGEIIWRYSNLSDEHIIPLLTPSGKVAVPTNNGFSLFDVKTGEEIANNPYVSAYNGYYIVV